MKLRVAESGIVPRLVELFGSEGHLNYAVHISETLGFIYVGELRPPLRNASCPTLPPQPLQRLGQRLAVEASRLPPRNNLADGEVRLPLAGARPAGAARRGPTRRYQSGGLVEAGSPELLRRG